MFGYLFGSPIQDKASLSARNANRAALLEQLFLDRCLKNFQDYHGYDVDPMEHRVSILRWYSIPWRKSPIPKVQRKQAA